MDISVICSVLQNVTSNTDYCRLKHLDKQPHLRFISIFTAYKYVDSNWLCRASIKISIYEYAYRIHNMLCNKQI